MTITEIKKIELASGILRTLKNRGLSIDDRLSILDLAIKSLKEKERIRNRRKKK